MNRGTRGPVGPAGRRPSGSAGARPGGAPRPNNGSRGCRKSSLFTAVPVVGAFVLAVAAVVAGRSGL